jgi:hypothetical protein
MIFLDKDFDKGTVDARFEGDDLVVTNAQDLDPILEDLQLRRLEQNEGGFSKERTMRFMGTVPTSVFALHPEFLHDTDALVTWLETDPLGRRFCVNKKDTGRSGQVIMK